MHIMEAGHARETMFLMDKVGFSCFCSRSLSEKIYHIILDSEEWFERKPFLKFALSRLATSPVVHVLTDEICISYFY